MHVHRRDYLVVVRSDRLHPVQLDVGYLRALLDVVNQYRLAALLLDAVADAGEEPHPEDRREVGVYCVWIERLTDLLRDVDSNRVFFDALIAGYLNLVDYRQRSLTARDGCREQRKRKRGDRRNHHCAVRGQQSPIRAALPAK